MNREPFFFDVTLRDGNQALKRPWNPAEKEQVFRQLVRLGVQAVEVGFCSSGTADLEACRRLASIAPGHMVISGLCRAVADDIWKTAAALKSAARPRIHIFLGLSPFHLQKVLRCTPEQARTKAVGAVSLAKALAGATMQVQFSVEHFGDCSGNLPFVIGVLRHVVEAGADTVNLSNTVERTRPFAFVEMVREVAGNLPRSVVLSVHCHNDLGMATATTVESYFAGATQLECSLNGLGERAGVASLFETAVSLHSNGISVPLNLSAVHETACLVAELSQIPVPEKSPLIGSDVLVHRSGIHQDGTLKTAHLAKGAYRAIEPSLIGRGGEEVIRFTGQSGKAAVFDLIRRAGYPITAGDASRLTPIIKALADKDGELSPDAILKIFQETQAAGFKRDT